MTDIIADGFQGKFSVNESLHAGMAQRVRAGPANPNAGLAQIMGCTIADDSPVQRCARSLYAEKTSRSVVLGRTSLR